MRWHLQCGRPRYDLLLDAIHFRVQRLTACLLAMEEGRIRSRCPAEIGGGFGGKTTVYLEPLAVLLSKKTGRPVKMVMTRSEVLRASGPTSGTRIKAKIGATRRRPNHRCGSLDGI